MGDFDALCLAILDAVERQQAEGKAGNQKEEETLQQTVKTAYAD